MLNILRSPHALRPLADRGPLRVMFVITCMPVGGAETLLVNLVRRLDRSRFQPELCCLKYLGPLGDVLAKEIPAHAGLLAHKYDFGVLGRLTALLRERRIDAVITVGTGGDKMFWGRLAAFRAGVPVILSALHSTGLPDHVERPNRWLAPITDGFIAVAEAHGRYIATAEGCPESKVFVVPNGVDVERFRPMPRKAALRAAAGIPADAPLAGIVAALRPEKNHELFLQAAARVRETLPEAHFAVIGDGPRQSLLLSLARELGLQGHVHFLGTRHDVPEWLAHLDAVLLTSHMEASPVSILEAMACGKPVVATRVGSIPETVFDGRTGFLVPPGDVEAVAGHTLELLLDRGLGDMLGSAARDQVIQHFSLARMVTGYERLIAGIYESKCRQNEAGRMENTENAVHCHETASTTGDE